MRKTTFITLTLLTAVCASVWAADPAPQVPAKAPDASSAQTPAATLDMSAPEKNVVHYIALENRDPFLPLIRTTNKPTGPTREGTGLPPAETYPLTQFVLKAIIMNPYGNNLAQVLLPDKKSYIIKEGMTVGDSKGTVVSIKSDEIIIREIVIDPLGKRIPKDTTLRLRKEEEK